MSDSNLNQNTSEDTSFPAAAPETNASVKRWTSMWTWRGYG